MSIRIAITALVGFVGVLALGGCGDASIETYLAPKDDPVKDTGDIVGNPGNTRAPIAWTLPSHWEQKLGSGIRFATLLIGPADQQIKMRVTPLGLQSGVVLDNVIRYGAMVGRTSISRKQLHKLTRQIMVNAVTVTVIDMMGQESADSDQPQQRLLAAIVPSQTRIWHFMAIGPPDVLEQEKPTFEKFLQSIQLAPDAALAPATDGQREEIEYLAPKTWIKDTRQRAMRLATFIIEGAQRHVEVTISSFPGNVGGLMNNINRWRVQQLGLAKIDELSEQPVERIDTANARGLLLDMTGPATAEHEGQRMLVVVISRNGWTWFFKMYGGQATVGTHKATFVEFVQSTRFVGLAK